MFAPVIIALEIDKKNIDHPIASNLGQLAIGFFVGSLIYLAIGGLLEFFGIPVFGYLDDGPIQNFGIILPVLLGGISIQKSTWANKTFQIQAWWHWSKYSLFVDGHTSLTCHIRGAGIFENFCFFCFIRLMAFAEYVKLYLEILRSVHSFILARVVAIFIYSYWILFYLGSPHKINWN